MCTGSSTEGKGAGRWLWHPSLDIILHLQGEAGLHLRAREGTKGDMGWPDHRVGGWGCLTWEVWGGMCQDHCLLVHWVWGVGTGLHLSC